MLTRQRKIYLDTNSLTFKKEPSWLTRNRKQLTIYFIVLMLSSVMVSKIILQFSTSPKEQLLVNENKTIMLKYHQLNSKFDEFLLRLDSLNNRDDSIYRSIFGVPAISKNLRKAGIGGSIESFMIDSIDDGKLVQKTSQRIKSLERKLTIAQHSYNEILTLASKNTNKMNHIPAIMPVSNQSLKYTGSGFGRRYHPILNIWRMHEGLDFVGERGTKIFVTGDGVVKKKYLSKTFGNVLIIDHGYGYETYYAHLIKYNVELGAKVKRGDLIGFMGSTGLSSGTHLHYEVHLNGKEVDPVHYFYNDLTPEQYNEIIDRANSFEYSMD